MGRPMFRLMALLSGGIYVAMLVGGQDRGQQRFGLMEKPAAPQVVQVAEAAAVEPTAAVVQAAFVPEKPVMVQPAAPVEVAAPVVDATPLHVMYIAAASANVREGPGKDHAVVGRLTQGEAVSVVVAGEGPEGWTLIRIEGDGLEGYIASRLLTE